MEPDKKTKKIKIVAISDTHDKHKFLADVVWPQADIFIHAGDFTRMSRKRQFAKFRQFLQTLPYKNKIVIPGNHDFGLEDNIQIYKQISQRFKVKPKQMVDPIKELQLLKNVCTLLINQYTEVQGVKIWGSPCVVSSHRMGFTYHDNYAEHMWKDISHNIDILLTHGPPRGILDVSDKNKLNVGCQYLRKAVQIIKPKCHIFGHIHECFGCQEVNGTRFYNVAYLNSEYSPQNDPVLIQLQIQDKY